jgi:hypothetical protein
MALRPTEADEEAVCVGIGLVSRFFRMCLSKAGNAFPGINIRGSLPVPEV